MEGIPENWTQIDADGDSFGWEPYEGDGYNDNFCVRSGSYIDGIGVLYPDNYLISPPITVANENYYLQFWVKPFSDYFFAEHYKVKIAVTDSTVLEPEYFTDTIFEETLQMGNWQMRELYLNDYLNQKIYIAWEHCNVSDQYYLMLDDIIVSDSLTSVEPIEIYPHSVMLRNYPNPFYSSTKIYFEAITFPKNAYIEIYNIAGQKVRQFSLENSQSSIVWNGDDKNGKKVSSGIYLYQLKTKNKTIADKKLIFLR